MQQPANFFRAAPFGRVRAMISAQMVPILAEVGMGARSMSSIFILLALSALSDFVLGKAFFSHGLQFLRRERCWPRFT
jgi:hypothetical protein